MKKRLGYYSDIDNYASNGSLRNKFIEILHYINYNYIVLQISNNTILINDMNFKYPKRVYSYTYY